MALARYHWICVNLLLFLACKEQLWIMLSFRQDFKLYKYLLVFQGNFLSRMCNHSVIYLTLELWMSWLYYYYVWFFFMRSWLNWLKRFECCVFVHIVSTCWRCIWYRDLHQQDTECLYMLLAIQCTSLFCLLLCIPSLHHLIIVCRSQSGVWETLEQGRLWTGTCCKLFTCFTSCNYVIM